MTKSRTDQAILISIALKLRVKPRATKFDKTGNLLELDYSYLKISELPSEIGQLSNLQVLDLSGNELSFLPMEIGLLVELKELRLENNQLQEVPIELWNLTNLKVLNLGESMITMHNENDEIVYAYDEDDDEDDGDDDEDDDDFEVVPRRFFPAHNRSNNISIIPSEIGQLKNLVVLDLTSNGLRNVPEEIGLLKNLTYLSLGNNRLTVIPDKIGQLVALDSLYLFDNELTYIPPHLSQLTSLRRLVLSGNQLAQIPSEIGQLKGLEILELGGNPRLLVPPPEIALQPTSQILEYLSELSRDSVTRYEAKMLLVGEGGTGKSTLLRALRGEEVGEPQSTTHGIEVGKYVIADPHNDINEITLNTWDFGGQQIYHATHQLFLTRRSLYLVVWNARLGADQGRLNYWLDTIKALAPDSPVLLVATHIDERAPDLNYLLYKEAYPQLVGSVSVSSTRGEGLTELKGQIAYLSSTLPHMGQPWPTTWIASEERLLALDDHHISANDYIRACVQSGVQETVASGTLGEFLHDLGKILFFRDDYILRNLIILKPNWVTKAISQVLTDGVTSNAKGILSHSDLPRIWKEDENGNTYEQYLYPVFLRLMERFDLSYQIEADTPGDHPTRSLVPQLLPHEPPVELPPWPRHPHEDDSLVEMLYKLDFVPAGIMSWFIVRTHLYTRNLHWREGVLLEYQGHYARVELNPLLRELRLVVWGTQPHNFFTILKNTVDLILSRFEGLNISRGVPCICHWGQLTEPRCSRFYRYEDLGRRMIARKHTIECPESFKVVSVPTMLFGIHTSTDVQVMEAIGRGHRDIRGKLERLESLDLLILDKLGQHSELIARNFTRQWNFEMQRFEAECPNTFWLTTHGREVFNPKDWVSQQYRLYLLCQHPPAPHTVGGGYTLRQSQTWWMAMGPWLIHLIRFIKFGIPMGSAVGAVLDESAFKKLEAQSDLLEEVAKAIPQLSDSPETMSFSSSKVDIAQDQQAVGAALRVLCHFLNQADPIQYWGGLSQAVTPDGNILWLCPAHREQYEAKPLMLDLADNDIPF